MIPETEQRILREHEDSIRFELAREFERMKTEGPAVGLTPAEMARFLMEQAR